MVCLWNGHWFDTDSNYFLPSLRELAELPYVKSCIALSHKQGKGSTASPSKGAKKERKYSVSTDTFQSIFMVTMLWTYHFSLPSCKRVQEFWVFAKYYWWLGM